LTSNLLVAEIKIMRQMIKVNTQDKENHSESLIKVVLAHFTCITTGL